MLLALLALSAPAAAADAPREVVWTGIDFGQVHMVGTLDFRDPEKIFPAFLDSWNGLYLGEMIPTLEKRLKSDVGASTSHLSELHAATDPAMQIVRDDTVSPDEAYLTPDDVAARVQTYALTATDGLGLVFIADQLNKPAQKGCYWVTFYDVGSRAVLKTSYRCGAARGFGFRNYWFGTAKDVTDQLKAKKDLP